jgi:trimeric autotransporter adhesin
MSTKTTFKRIALVAVAALGLGTMSVAPSSAAVLVGAATNTLATVSSSSTIVAGETATLTFTSTWVAGAALDSVSVAAYGTSSQSMDLRLSVSDSSTSVAGAVRVVDAGSTSATDTSAQVGANVSAAITATYKLHVYAPQVAGTYAVSVYASKHDAGVNAGTAYTTPLTWSFTVTARDTAPTANSTVTLRSGDASGTAASPFGGTAEGTDSSTASTATRSITGSTPAATIYVVQKNAAGTAGESVTVVATGPAFISTSPTSRPVAGSALTLAHVTAGTVFYVWSTGTAGTATITTSTPSLAMGTKTIKFFGAATKLAVSTAVATNNVIYTKAGTATDNVAVIAVTDTNGNAVTSAQTFTCTPSDKLQISSCAVSGTYSSAVGGFVLSTVSAAGTSGKAVTLTVTIADPADTTGVAKLTTTHAVTMGGAVAKEVISFDKTSYSPGEQMIITITATDASGNPAYTGAATPALSSNKSVQGIANVATTYTGGKADSVSRDTDGAVLNSYRVFAPATSGEFKVSATGTDALATLISATGTVADPAQDAATDAANEATDAANAATDAALAAADAADAATAAAQDASDAVAALSASVSKLISSLRAQITSLTNLVIKIQKKVRA